MSDQSKEPAAKSDQIDFTKIPDQTITIIVKNKGEARATGLTLPVIEEGMPEEDLLMALQRIKDASTRLLHTVYYTYAGKDKTTELPELE